MTQEAATTSRWTTGMTGSTEIKQVRVELRTNGYSYDL